MEVKKILNMNCSEKDKLRMLFSNRMNMMIKGDGAVTVQVWDELFQDLIGWKNTLEKTKEIKMKQTKKKERLVHINDFCNECGWFDCSSDDPCRSDVCTHPECQDVAEDEAGEYRRCFTFSCPLGYEADFEDMKRLDPEFAETLTVGDWIVV